MTTEVYINNVRMDLPLNVEDLHFPISYSITDLKNPQKRKRNFSKTITLPGTQNNNKFFESAYDLARIDTDGSGFGFDFDPTLRYPCRVFRDGQLIFSGAMNLNSVIREDSVNSFNVTLYSAMTDIFQQLGDITISELGWSEYDHVLSVANIQASWVAAIGSGYVYPLIDYGFTDDPLSYKTNELRPFVYCKELFEKCFEKAGFNVSSTFVSSLFFRDFIIGYGGGDPIDISASEKAARRAHYTGDGSRTDVLPANKPNALNYEFLYTLTSAIADNDDITLNVVTDTKGQLDESTGELVIANNGNYTLTISADMDVTWSFLLIVGLIYNLQATVRLEIFKNYALIGSQEFTISDNVAGSETLNFNLSQNIDADPGDVITSRFIITTNDSTVTGLDKHNGEITLGYDLNATLDYDLVATNEGLIDGDTVELARHLPKMKAADFLSDMIAAFNLYVDDPDANDNVIVEPFDDFYHETDDTDSWSDKVDHKGKWEIKPATTIKGKSYVYRFAEDRDYYKERYFKQYGIDYGDFVYNVPSTFKVGEKVSKLKSTQSVPVQLEGTDIIIPRILKYDEGTGVTSPHKGKPRIFKYLGTVASDSWDLVNSDTGAATANVTYPLAHHLDDLDNPTFDYNFGRPEVVYYAATSYTTFNLFYKYHARLIRELTGRASKILNVMVDLKTTDLYKGFMRRLKNIDGVLWRVNIVKDFLVTRRTRTKVELIRVVESFSKKDFEDALPELPQLPIDTGSPVTGDETVKSYKTNYLVDTTAGGVTITLDPDNLQPWKKFEIKWEDGSPQNKVTVDPINGAEFERSTQSTQMVSIGDNWSIVFDGQNFHLE